ncbi:glycosyltransferase [Agreia sp. COWG]|uniref:glycosyltransferase n=1 Tax=Agreia sp. COWG TaxID=2773266 RepID=UPI0019258871|nr:glycosyltransferase [Agreia sp. COWG]CAD6003852.1 UDP-N-acetylglucosamine:LPS N-acetylglucosamine transferase [Agreia sp. COWG]
MIGYYIHHQGRGHLNRALAIAAELDGAVTGLSSLAKPAEWVGNWVQLPRDDESASIAEGADAQGRLHWVPVGDDGIRNRAGMLSRWLSTSHPDLMIVDVSVEVALLTRLHGVEVVTIALPGERGDEAHRLGYDISRVILAAWPRAAEGMITGLSHAARARLECVGAISRFSSRVVVEPTPPAVVGSAPRRRVLVLGGAGGSSLDETALAAAQLETPQWEWAVLGGRSGRWVDDPWPEICTADVVVTHAGQNALADVAAAGRPAIVIPEDRPHGEQRTTASVLERSDLWPALVRQSFPRDGWPSLLEDAAALDGSRWQAWNDGLGARTAAAIIKRELLRAAASQTGDRPGSCETASTVTA